MGGSGPAVELGGVADRFHVGGERWRAAERASLSGVQGVGLAVTGGLAVAFADGDGGIASILTGFQTITSGLVDGEGQVGRIDLEDIVAIETPHANINCTRAQLNLHGAVVEV